MGHDNNELAARVESISDSEKKEILARIVLAGDLSRLDSAQKVAYYKMRCDQLGLPMLSQPFAILRLNGKEILYPTRSATDQLAAMHKLSRETVEGPEIRDFEGLKFVYCKVRAVLPDGRSESAVAILPARSIDDTTLMKAETKAKRRVTISILGLGFNDEPENEGLPVPIDLSVSTEQPSSKTASSTPAPTEEEAAPPVTFDDALAEMEEQFSQHDREITPNYALSLWLGIDGRFPLTTPERRDRVLKTVSKHLEQHDVVHFQALVADVVRYSKKAASAEPGQPLPGLAELRGEIRRCKTFDDVENIFSNVAPSDLRPALLDDGRARVIELCETPEDVALQVSRLVKVRPLSRVAGWLLSLDSHCERKNIERPEALLEALLVFSSDAWHKHLMAKAKTPEHVAGSLHKRAKLFEDYRVLESRRAVAIAHVAQMLNTNGEAAASRLSADIKMIAGRRASGEAGRGN